jgi:hypothetical protein
MGNEAGVVDVENRKFSAVAVNQRPTSRRSSLYNGHYTETSWYDINKGELFLCLTN